MSTDIIFDSITQTGVDQLEDVTITISSDGRSASINIGSRVVRVDVDGVYVRSISSSGSGIYQLAATDPIFEGTGSVEFSLYIFDSNNNRIVTTWDVEISESSSDSSPPPEKDASEVLDGMTDVLADMRDCLCSLSSTLQGIQALISNPEQGAVVRPANSEDWALQRASTISSLREAFQLQNVFDEMENPTGLPVQARSESELETVDKRQDAITPQGNNAADYPNINQGGNAGTPVDPDEFKTPLDRTLDEEENQEEDSGVNKCHPL